MNLDGPAAHPRVVVLRALGLGDLCTAVPALRAIRAAFPNHELVLCAAAWQAALARLADVDRVSATAPLGEVAAREAAPDIAINLHGRGPQSTRRLLDLVPRRLIAFRHPVLPETEHAPRWSFDEHEVVRWCRLLEHSGIPADPRDLRLAVPSAEPPVRGAVVVHPGAAQASRRWPVQRWGRVAAGLAAAGHDVRVTGGPDERGLAEDVARTAGLGPEAVLAGRTDLLGLCALVAAARLLVSPDTGVAHLATAFGTPSVVLFGPTPPSLWGPPADRPQHRALWAGRTGDNFATAPDPGLLALTVEQVLDAALT